MNSEEKRRRTGAMIVGGALLLALASAALVWLQVGANPRTDDGTVRANYIEVAPEISGRMVELHVHDNQAVERGALLFVIDERPFRYALEQALADQELLEKQIEDTQRRIGAQQNGVEAAQAGVMTSRAYAETAGSGVEAAHAAAAQAEAAVQAGDAQLALAASTLRRLEPLLKRQYVTVEQVDQARAALRVAEQHKHEAEAALARARANESEAAARHKASQAVIAESQARLGQSIRTVDTLDSLMAQRPARAARVESARLDLERCRVVAPFAGYVTNCNLSEGAFAQAGKPLFTLIDRRNWYVVANFRESELNRIARGQKVDVYLMGRPDRRFAGVVDSIGFGVFPEDGRVDAGLPAVEKTVNWVHLAARFPVRVRIEDPDPALLRIGETAVSIVRQR